MNSLKTLKIMGFCILIFLLVSKDSKAAGRYWVGTSSNKNWNTTANWSATSGGTGGASIPSANDTAIFDGGDTVGCIINTTISVYKLNMKSSYPGTIQQSGNIVVVGAGGFKQDAGTFLCTTAAFFMQGPFTLNGGTFVSTTGQLKVQGNFTINSPGNFVHNNGQVMFTGILTVKAVVTLYDCQFYSGALGGTFTMDASTVLTIKHTLSQGGIINGTGIINAHGDLNQNGGGGITNGGTATITINGTTDQTFTGGTLANNVGGATCHIVISKPAGTTLFLAGIITIGGNWINNSSALNVGSSTLILYGTKTITEYNALNNLSIYSPGIAATTTISTSTLVVNGDLSIGGGAQTITGGDIEARGNIVGLIYFGQGMSGGNSSIIINGEGEQLITGTTAAGAGILRNIKINKTLGILKLSGNISISGAWTWLSGTVDITSNSSTISCMASTVITGNQSFKNMLFYAASGATVNFNIDPATTLNVTGDITIQAIGTGRVNINGGTIESKGNITLVPGNNLLNGIGGGTALLKMNGDYDQTITGTTTLQSQAILPNVEINKTSGNLNLSGIITAGGHWTCTAGSGNMLPGTSTLAFVGGGTITGSQPLYDLLFAPPISGANVFTIASGTTLAVGRNLSIAGVGGTVINTGTINVAKDVIVSSVSTLSGGTGVININGSTNQTLTGSGTLGGGRLCSVNIAKTGGVLTLASMISVSGNWSYNASSGGTIDAGTSTVAFYDGPRTISGTHALNNVYFYATIANGVNNISSNDVFSVDGDLKFFGTYPISINTGTISAKGHITMLSTNTTDVTQTGVIKICGNGSQTLTGSGTYNVGKFGNITVDKPSGTLTLASTITIRGGTWLYVQGDVNPGTSEFCSSGSVINCGTAPANMSLYTLFVYGTTASSLANNLTVKNICSIDVSRVLNSNSYDISVGGRWTNLGTVNMGTGSIIFNGTGTQVITSAETMNRVVINKPSGKLKPQAALTISGSLTLTKGVIVTTTTGLLSFSDNATVTGGSNQSYVAGPLKKIGDDIFTFPLGDTTLPDTSAYHPFSITAPPTTTDAYTAQYYAHNQLTDHSTFTSYASTLKPVSTCEYWSLTRNVGSSTITPTVGWNANTCNINALADARIASWSGTTWADLGQNSTTGNQTVGTVKANTAGPNTANQYYVLAERMPTPIANQRYWIGNGSNKSWNNTANWAVVSGGPGGNPVPTQNDTVIFDGGGKGESDIDVNVSVAKLLVKSTYNTNAIVQGAYTITVGTGGMTLNGGAFTGGSAAITNNGSLTLGGTNFTSTSATFTIFGSYTKTAGSFIHNNGKILLKIGTTISGSTNFYNLELSPTGDAVYTLVSSDVLNVLGEFKLSGAPLININSGTIHAQGDLTLANTNVDILGSYTLVIDGTGTQTINGAAARWQSALNNVVITKATGTVVLKDFITVRGNWTNTNNTATDVSNISTVFFNGGSKTISGNTTFKNLIFYADGATDGIYTIPPSSTVTTEGELKFEGTRPLYLNGKINAKGDIVTFNGSGSLVDGGTGSITICGTGAQLFSGYDAPKGSRTCNIIIDKVSGTLTLDRFITPGHDWTYVKGTMNPGTSTVYFTNSNSRTVSGKNKFNNVVFYGENLAVNDSNHTDVVDTMFVDGELKYSLRVMTINGGTIAAKGNITIESDIDVVPGTYTLLITGSNNQLLTGTANMQARAALNNVVIHKTGGLLSLKDKISVKGNWIYEQGNLDAKTNLSTLILRDGNRTFSGTHALYNVTLKGYDSNAPTINEIPVNDIITVEGEFKLDGGYPAYLNTGTINATGPIRSTNSTTAQSGGTATINICGTTDQSMSGQYNGGGRFCNIKVNKPSGILNLSENITVGASNWTYVQGIVNPGTSKVVFWGDGTVNTVNGTSSMKFYNFEIQNGTVTMLNPIIAEKDFKTWGSTTLVTNSHDISVGGYFQNGGVFNMGTTTITFNGTGRQDEYTSTNTSYYKVVINKPSGKVFIDNSFVINNNLTLIKGALVPKSSNPGHYVKLLDNATITGGSNASYIACGVMKVGDDAFTFPVGDTTLTDSSTYHPFSIPAPATSATYTVRYYAKNPLTDHPTFTAMESPLQSISNCEYWYVEGGPAITPTLSWSVNNSNVNALADIRVGSWDGTQWKNLGNSSTTGDLFKGTIQAANASTSAYDKYFVVGNINDVHLDPVASFENPGGTCVNKTITFINTSLHASSYQWKVNNANVSTNTNLTYAFNTIGTYTVTLVVDNGTDTKNINFIVGSGITADAGTDKTIVSGESIILGGTPTAVTGTAPFTYTWSPSTNLSSSIVPNPNASPSITITYNLTIQDAQGCSGTDAVQVTVEESYKSYAELKKALDAGYYQVNTSDHKLYFNYTEEYKSGNLNFKIYDNTHELKSCPTVLAKQYGDNQFGIDLMSCLGASTAKYYILEVINDKSEKLLLKFKY